MLGAQRDALRRSLAGGRRRMSGGAGVPAPRELDHVIGDLEHVRVVRGDHDGRAEARRIGERVEQCPCALVVELRRRLVDDHDRRAAGERDGE